MKSKDYEYIPLDDEYEISDERKEILIEKVKNQISKGFIAHYQILKIGKNDEEWDFLYSWLDDNDIQIRGINGTISGEISNYNHIPKMGQNIMGLEPLDLEEEMKLFRKLYYFSEDDKKNNIPEYQQTRNKIIEHNIRLAKFVANWKCFNNIQIPIEDKYQMAYLGLIDAVDKFDYQKGYRFSTYACKVIMSRIYKEIYREDVDNKQRMEIREQLAMIPDIENQMLVSLGRKAKPYEIADILGISLKEVHNLNVLRKMQEKDSLEQIESDIKDKETVYSKSSDTDQIIKTDSGYIIDGVYMDEEDVLPIGFREKDRVANKAMTNYLKGDLRQLLTKLKEIEQGVLAQRYGLDDGIPKTQKEIGMSYNVTGGYIGMVEHKALRKLRCGTFTKEKFEPYLEVVKDNEDERE